MNINEFEKTQTLVDDLSESPFSEVVKLKSQKVVITGPILKKNRREHKDMNRFYKYLSSLVKDPDFICRNRRDPEILICYKTVKNTRLRAAVWLSPKDKENKDKENFHNSILSFRGYHQKELGTEKKRGRVLYERK